MKICIIGATGMLGWTFFRRLIADASIEVSTITRRPFDESNKNYVISDFTSTNELKNILQGKDFDWVINCAGAIKQRAYCKDYEMIDINATFPHRVYSCISESETQLLNFSTDCVFSGDKGNYSDDDVHDAKDVYGKSKSLGELSFSNCLTLRTSIIGHGITPNKSLIDWFWKQRTGRVSGYSEAIYSGFPTIYVADFFVNKILYQGKLTGVYNFSANPISKYHLLQIVNAQYNLGIDLVMDPSVQIDRSLDSSNLRELLSWEPPAWEELIYWMYEDVKGWRIK